MDFYLFVKYEVEDEVVWSAIRPLEGTQEEAQQLAALLNRMNQDKDYTFTVEECNDLDPAGGTGLESHI